MQPPGAVVRARRRRRPQPCSMGQQSLAAPRSGRRRLLRLPLPVTQLLLGVALLIGPLALLVEAAGVNGGRSGRQARIGAFVLAPSRWPAAAAKAGAGQRHRRQRGLARCFVDRREDGGKEEDQEQRLQHQQQQRLLQQSQPDPPSAPDRGPRRQRREAPTTSRRDHVVSGGLLAGAVTATMLGARARAETTPVYMDREVWAPLEDYMQMEGGRAEQKTYSPKFTAYLARLLINYDYASASWWQRKTLVTGGPESAQRINRLLGQKGFEATFAELDQDGDAVISREEFRAAVTDPEVAQRKEQELLAQLQASVNFGLVRYQGREGVGRLMRLLRSEFGVDRVAKRQIALLFALMDNLQPVEAIKQLIAETENATVVAFNVTYPGFGYDPSSPPRVTVSPGPGSNVSAQASVRLRPTGRLLKLQLDEPVTGFPLGNRSAPPTVEISAPGAEGGVRAVGIPKMNGDAIERIVLSNPGQGYTERDHVTVHLTGEGLPAPWLVRQAKPVLEMQVAAIEVKDGGSGYAHDLPIAVEIGKPPFPVSAVATAKATAVLSEPKELILRSWLPPANVSIPVTGLLPSNLAPKYDPCLERFIISPVEELDPNYCIYFEDEFKVVPSQKFNKYFSFLDGPKARDPVEKERELDASVFWRFAVSGALCCSTAHAFLIPLDVVKTKMQADPAKYPTFVAASKRIYAEGGPRSLLLGAGATVLGYLVYGAVSFGLTEYFKRLFLELAGPEYATFYPFAILLLASMSAAFFGAVAVTPFEALRIRSVTAAENSAATDALAAAALAASPAALAGEGGASGTCEASVEEALAEAEAAAAAAEEEASSPPATSAAAFATSSVASASTSQPGGAGAAAATAAGGQEEEKEEEDAESTTLVAMVARMVREGTLGELFAGLGPAVVGEIPFMMAKFAVFDAVSKGIYALFPTANDSVALSLTVSLVSGMTAGVAAAVISQPFDTLTTKVTQYTQQRRKGGIFPAVKDIYGQGGVGGFFKGTFPRAVKSAANIALQFFLYDFSKRALHVSADDLKLFFDVMSGLCLGSVGQSLCSAEATDALAEMFKK